MNGLLATWTERLRRHLLAGVEADIARLRQEVEAQRAALKQAESLRPLLAEIEERTARPPEQIAAELRPFIEDLVRQRESQRARERSRRRRRAAAVVAAVAAIGAGGLWWWRNGSAELSLAARAEARAAAAVPPVEASAPAVAAARLVREESIAGFGLGQSTADDADLEEAVRARLSACPSLAGAEIRFAAKDGWVWLRGRASDAGREAAGEALAGLGDGVVVVNQIEGRPADLLAER